MGSNPIHTFCDIMSKKYYIRRWKKLDNYYSKLHKINDELKDKPNDEDLINKKLIILKKIKHFLRYEAGKEDYRS